MFGDFRVGQTWEVPKLGPNSRMFVGSVTPHSKEPLVHVSVLGVPVPEPVRPRLGGRDETNFLHMALSLEAAKRSAGVPLDLEPIVPAGFGDALDDWMNCRTPDGSRPVHRSSVVDVVARGFSIIDEGTVAND